MGYRNLPQAQDHGHGMRGHRMTFSKPILSQDITINSEKGRLCMGIGSAPEDRFDQLKGIKRLLPSGVVKVRALFWLA